jgi:type VI secretion system secreted protein VgrG
MHRFSANSTWFTFDAGGGFTFGVYAFSGVEEAHRPFEFAIELVHDSANIDFSEFMGQPASLSIADRSGGVRHVHGVIRQFTYMHTANSRSHYRCLLVPRFWYLGLVTDHRIFQNMSVVQIIEQILNEQGFAGDAYSFRCFHEYAPREYCVQYGESSLHFISRLCEEEGIYFFFEHSASAHVLCFSDREGGPRIEGESELRFHPGSGNVTDTAVINRVVLRQSVRSDLATYREWNFRKPKLDLGVSQHEPDPLRAPAPAGMKLEQYRYPHLYELRQEGQRYANLQLLRQLSLQKVIDIQSDASRFAPGYTFAMHGHPRPEVNCAWWTQRVEHRGEQPQVLEDEAPDRGMSYVVTVLAIPEATRFVPELAHPRTRIEGKQTAIVTGPEGEEIYPDKYGRVKVQFFWDRADQWNENTTRWVRVCQGWAGSAYGIMAIPRIGHEVIIGFLEGDPDRPLVEGRVYHELNMPPYALPEHKTRTVFKSMSTPGVPDEARGFNELRIEDRRGEEEIYMHAEKDVNVHVKNDWREHILRDQHRTVDRFSYTHILGEEHHRGDLPRKTDLLQDDHLTVRGSSHTRIANKWLGRTGQELHFQAGDKVVVEAGQDLTVKAGGAMLRLTPAGVTITGSAVRINEGGSPGAGSGASPLLPVPPEHVGKYTEHFVLQNNEGQPLVKVPYEMLLESGEVVSGTTDMQGRTHLEVDKCIKDVHLGLSYAIYPDLE